MLLRSSSTPVLGSLLNSIAESPNNSNHHETSSPLRHYPSKSPPHPNHNKLSFHPSPGYVHFSTTVSSGSSPASPFLVNQDHKGFRRVQSEGNLEGLVHAAGDVNEESYNQNQTRKLSARPKCSTLETIPSFSFSNSRVRCEKEEEYDSDLEEGEEVKENEERLERSEGRVMATNRSHELNATSMLNKVRVGDKIWSSGFEDERKLVGQEMFLAIGFGTAGGSWGGVNDGSGGGGGREFNPAGSSGDGDDNHKVQEYYKRMVEENPGNPLFLRNYAQYLYQSKKDLAGAEEYYARAVLADPRDGEALSQYAQLLWELHHDEERASSYFERAVQVSRKDSYVQAAYASFLWETEENEDECAVPSDIDFTASQLREGTLASA